MIYNDYSRCDYFHNLEKMENFLKDIGLEEAIVIFTGKRATYDSCWRTNKFEFNDW